MEQPDPSGHWHDLGAACNGCACDLIVKVREDMLAKCIAVIEAMPTICDDLDWPHLDLTVPEIISEIKAEKP